ncbi:MAG: FAD-dependent oxidoreductase [Paracoccus sp. (in: a-proteobacteria)]|nr:FAD-dependent oxidoreductase [Paracoccus sp. (in: a-proteobacteria)]
MIQVTIIGAGVAGLWAAYRLAQAGASIRLIDRHGAPGPHGCSWWAGGMLAPGCEGAVAEPIITRLGRAAATSWAEITEVTQRGSLVAALGRDRSELAQFARRTSGHQLLDRTALAELEPELAASEALYYPDEAHLNPRRALADLVAALREMGVEIIREEVDPRSIKGHVIDARGMGAAEGAALDHVADAQATPPPITSRLRGVRGEMAILRSPEITLSRPVRLLHPRHPLYIVPREGGVFMLGATQIETGARGPITARSLLELLSAAYALDPRFAQAELIETGADLRPAFPGNIPRAILRGNVLHLNGLFRHGFLLAPALAGQAVKYLIHNEKGELFHED